MVRIKKIDKEMRIGDGNRQDGKDQKIDKEMRIGDGDPRGDENRRWESTRR